MLYYQHKAIREISEIDPEQPQCCCLLDDGSSVWIPFEWIDESQKGELDTRLSAAILIEQKPNLPVDPAL